MDPELAKLMKLRRQKSRAGAASSSDDEPDLIASVEATPPVEVSSPSHLREKYRSSRIAGDVPPLSSESGEITPRLITRRTITSGSISASGREKDTTYRRQRPSRESSGDDKSIMSERSHTSRSSTGSGGPKTSNSTSNTNPKTRSRSDYGSIAGVRRSKLSGSSPKSSRPARPRRSKSTSLDLDQLDKSFSRKEPPAQDSSRRSTVSGNSGGSSSQNEEDEEMEIQGNDQELSLSTDDEEEEMEKTSLSRLPSGASSSVEGFHFDAAFGNTAAFDSMPLQDATLSDPNSNAAAAFESDFGSFPSGFGEFPTTSTTGGVDDGDHFATALGTKDYTVSDPNTTFGTDKSSDDLAPFAPPPQVYDKSPISDPPVNYVESATIKIKFISPKPKLKLNTLTPPPVASPLTGHLIYCRQDNTTHDAAKVCCLSEWNPHMETQVLNTPILTVEFQRKIAQKYNVCPRQVEQVLTLAVGVHHAQGYERCRVAALLDLQVMENKEVLRVIAIWQWGYGGSDVKGGHPVSLQSVLSPPSGSDFSYQLESLLIRDSCVFVAGASAKGPCVFLCKPTIRETWSANFVGRVTTRVTHMAATVCNRGPTDPDSTKAHSNENFTERLPYLAIALTDGTVSVWTYEAATKLTGKNTETVKRLLFPVCRLESVKSSKSWPVTPWNPKESASTNMSVDIGHCTHLEWVTKKGSSYNQLLLLAASFQGGLCLYHVALPKVQEKGEKKYVDIKKPTDKTTLGQTVSIKPFCCSKWASVYHKAFASWIDLGPHVPPSLAILLTGLETNADYARMAMVTSPIEAFDGRKKSLADRLSFHVWDSHEWTKRLSHLPRELIVSTFYNTRGILYCSDTAIQEIEYRTNTRFPTMSGGVGSIPVGLTTSGTNHWTDVCSPAGAGVLSVYTTYHCERCESSAESSLSMLEWSTPSRRHWLIQTFIGDSKESSAPNNIIFASSFREEKENDDVVLGGSQPTVLCELSARKQLKGLYPYRIVRSPYSGGSSTQHIAVWFRPLFGNSERMVIGLIEQDEDGRYSVVQLIDGRDIIFLPHSTYMMEADGASSKGQRTASALVVSRNGGAVALWQRKGVGGALKTPWQDSGGIVCRPILGIQDETSKTDFVEIRQFVLNRYHDQLSLLAVGSKSNGKTCLVAGNFVPEEGLSWLTLLPNIKEYPVFWLNEREQVSIVLPLPNEGRIKGGFGLATTYRILILSSDLKLMAEQDNAPPPGSLVPLGSCTVAYCAHGEYKIRYLSGLPGSFGKSGHIASFPQPIFCYCPHWLLSIRPDRFLFNSDHNGTRLVERGQPSNAFLLPFATTRPSLLLEPMIANAIATGGNDAASQPFLRGVIEKFGRKVSTMTHGDDEGVGNFGAGITPRVYELLEFYNLRAAATWLLTGTIHFNRSSNSRIMPPWMPVSAKIKAAQDPDSNLHVLSNGDQYLTEYMKSPDQNMSSTLPRPSDPSSLICRQLAMDAIISGDFSEAIKMLDIVGTENSDALILQLSMAMQLRANKDINQILKVLYSDTNMANERSAASSVKSFAALSTELNMNKPPSTDFIKRWMLPLAPSMQRWRKAGRHRTRLFGESVLSEYRGTEPARDPHFSRELPESKLVWNEGPNKEKDKLLVLDHFEDWFGRRRPAILGKEGAKNAEDRGASTLADILNANDDDSFGGENDDDFKDGWVDGVGEGLKDEDKLSAYFRFSEGEEEETAWQEEGFADISKFENTAIVYGCADSAALQESTSSVDEGENGKVKALFDLVFERSGVGLAAALAIPAPRGGSLDIGLMHGPDHLSRQKCTIEFWFWVPESISKEIILARRTFGSSADDLESACKASDKSSLLWELGLKKNGELEFRTLAGKSLKTKPVLKQDDDVEETQKSAVHFAKWNHVCITLKQESITSTSVTIYSRGEKRASSDIISVSPPGFEIDDFSGASALDPMLEKSHLVYGLDHPQGFRLTELRVWAMERNDDDIRTLMTEYLESAEIKKKFKVKIKKKCGPSSRLGTPQPEGEALAPSGVPGPPAKGIDAASKALLSPPGALKPPGDSGRPSSTIKRLLAPPKRSNQSTPSTLDDNFGGFGSSTTPTSLDVDAFGGRSSTSTFGSELQGENLPLSSPSNFAADVEQVEPEISPLWESAIPLSEQVRSSAAAALIRGPPATRHFGGNRGGLPDYRELERCGVGAISICGSEKTIVWRDDQAPPGLTYPIGASGAIVSDQMDDDGSEFLCCFLAKDKRMVVFELSTRTVVVELQMTTKLNYWRFLPPEAGEDTLCFMLVTPVGGFHWMPLDESPRPRQVWKRGPELQGKKIVCYEEGGSNGLNGPDILSQVGMLLVTNGANGGRLEAWLVPICGDSQAICASDDIMGACLCQPPGMGYEAFMPLLLFVVESDDDLVVCVSAVVEDSDNSVGLTEVMTDALISQGPYQSFDFEPPTLAMGTYPEILCCSLGSTIVIIVRRKGLVIAYELAETGLELIAQENVGHYVIDAVMRYSALEGGAEIVLLMSDDENPRDGRVGTFCFRTAG